MGRAIVAPPAGLLNPRSDPAQSARFGSTVGPKMVQEAMHGWCAPRWEWVAHELLPPGPMAIGTALDPRDLWDPPPQFGAYRVIHRIAEGGTANVFRGEHPETGMAVALKTVRTGLAHEVAVLQHEIETLRALRHPGIVRFLDAGACDGVPWMAVELLEGRSLFEVITGIWTDDERRRRQPGHDNDDHGNCLSDLIPNSGGWAFSLQDDPSLAFPTRKAAAGQLEDALIVVQRLLPALDYVHHRGIVHGDVKPPNIYLDDQGRVTLLDFGAAHHPRGRGDVRQAGGLRLGTMEYAAPEQIAGQRIDVTADIYSLGCILYEMVTGHIPFEGESHGDIGRKHLDEDPICPSELVSGVWGDLETLMMDMLAKRPSQRPRSARAVAARIAPLLHRCHQQMPHG